MTETHGPSLFERGLAPREDLDSLRMHQEVSTGLQDLDRLLCGLIPGDNVVWQVQEIGDYAVLVLPFCRQAVQSGRKILYFRFARHPRLLSSDMGVQVYDLNPQGGFESFLNEIHEHIDRAGPGAFYVFDCLSELAVDWFSDQMLGNFFVLTCPYLYDLETIAYFAVSRNYHSSYAVEPIRKTTQLWIDVYHYQDNIYVRPLKAQGRHSSNMNVLHRWKEDRFDPVMDSCTIASVMRSSSQSALELTIRRVDVWSRAFLAAEELLNDFAGLEGEKEKEEEVCHKLLRTLVSRDERMLSLAKQHLNLSDVLEIGKRTIGTGMIGGKAVGMLLARAILEKKDPHGAERLEMHDSFFIASDVFYSFLVHNGCWEICRRRLGSDSLLKDAERARQQILRGTFPAHILQQFVEMLDYFGHCPIIVRSSSLLEDNFGNSFVGKYESVFCPNQGPSQSGLDDFLSAVKTVYASALSKEALSYRARHGILDRDEQMALLVQRVSGSLHGKLFYPEIAGVGFSFNPYVWNQEIDPKAGVIRLVMGLGTRAVNRSDDDYTRIVALNAPHIRPEAGMDEVRRYSQRKVDVLDLEGNRMSSVHVEDLLDQRKNPCLDLLVTRDMEAERRAREQGYRLPMLPLLTFDRLLAETDLVSELRGMLGTLGEAYGSAVDIEFTVNFLDREDFRINLVQCRPFLVKSDLADRNLQQVRTKVQPESAVLETCGPLVGKGRWERMEYVLYICPSLYGYLGLQERYALARLLGEVLRLEPLRSSSKVMLIGPGRWGTRTPSLGVPVSFSEISHVSVLCEIVIMREDLIPDVSLGTHFFSELIESDILYMALFPRRKGSQWNQAFFEGAENLLSDLLPTARPFEEILRVIWVDDTSGTGPFEIYADPFRQYAVCYLEEKP